MTPWPAAIAALLLGAGCAGVLQPTPTTASAELKNARGQVVGTATLAQVSDGVRMLVTVSGLPPGVKAVHIHEVGRCDSPAFTSAGEHFNPGRTAHGLLNPGGPHAGDLPNILIEADGTGRLETFNERITLIATPNTLFDEDGSSLVIHGAADDHRTDPTGNSGARIACGVVVKK